MSSLLLPGTVTWESYNGRSSSTIDLMLASANISNSVSFYGIDQDNYRSNYRAIRVHFDISL